MAGCNHINRHEVTTQGGDLFAEVCLGCDVRFFPCDQCALPRPEGKCHGLCQCGRFTACREVEACARCVPEERTCVRCYTAYTVRNTSRRKYCSDQCRRDASRDRRADQRAARAAES